MDNVKIYDKAGGQVIANTTLVNAPTGTDFKRVQVITAAVFANTTRCNITGIDGPTFPVGMIIPGSFTAIQLSSGSIIAYAS